MNYQSSAAGVGAGAGTSPNPGSPSSDKNLSDDPNHASCSLNCPAERKKDCIKSEELQKNLEDEKKKSGQYQETIQKLEEKVSNLESEIQVLKMAAQETGEAKGKFEKRVEELTWRTQLEKRLKTDLEEAKNSEMAKLQEALQAMQLQLQETKAMAIKEREAARKAVEDVIVEDTEKFNSLNDELERIKGILLIKSISEDLGFSEGKPVAACLIYKCLLEWRLFEVERTSIFDCVIGTIAGAMESQDDRDVLSYWLSNCASLLLLLQRTLKANGTASLTLPQRLRTSSASMLDRVSQVLQGSPRSAGSLFGRSLSGVDELHQVEGKYPALLFKQQLTTFLEKIYGLIRDNLKKEISPVLAQCIQAPRTSRGSLVRGRSQANAVAQQALIAHWQNIVKTLNNHLNTLRANHVPSFLVLKVFTQTFSFINVQLFNSILLRRECCSFSNGGYVKSGLSELELWCREYAGSAWEELKHIRQAVGFLVIHQKSMKSLIEITNDLCPALSIHQLFKINAMNCDYTDTLSAEVIQSMRVMMAEESGNQLSTRFILEDDSSIPFTVEDIAKSVEAVEMVDVDLPPLLRQNSSNDPIIDAMILFLQQ